ncbi:hypothetical protein [Clostridium septicum]|uniref:Uncharacterized protein n=1 Tax=Clostridium septicum TaxID=1504 RepID=A0A9N7PL21_CLOSE|nr:hypothetical protein [Clostridium septicum]AYE33392.1 hypothetical protein CP523_02405 [Clostridium septicum]MDU1314000.1 hypothetical protein [Clostridium septicum]QAS61564.1 hypothetical protein EI377_12925 [Clostridium septicum]UEC21998.1 hypothetical protein LK444_06460 [Clostridium septicum]USR99970.1 hypothetical protein NH397_10735 [Clostridium septicum]
MYIAFGRRVVDSEEVRNTIVDNSEFRIVKDMSKGSKREDIVAFNLSIDIGILREVLEDDYDLNQLSEDELFEEYLSLAEELATDIEEFCPDESLIDIKAYKLDESDNDIKLVMVIAHEELGEPKLRDVMKRLLTQVE